MSTVFNYSYICIYAPPTLVSTILSDTGSEWNPGQGKSFESETGFMWKRRQLKKSSHFDGGSAICTISLLAIHCWGLSNVFLANTVLQYIPNEGKLITKDCCHFKSQYYGWFNIKKKWIKNFVIEKFNKKLFLYGQQNFPVR